MREIHVRMADCDFWHSRMSVNRFMDVAPCEACDRRGVRVFHFPTSNASTVLTMRWTSPRAFRWELVFSLEANACRRPTQVLRSARWGCSAFKTSFSFTSSGLPLIVRLCWTRYVFCPAATLTNARWCADDGPRPWRISLARFHAI